MAWDGNYIWAMDVSPNSQYSLLKLDTTGTIVSIFPAEYSCWGGGIAWADSNIYYGVNTCSVPESRKSSMIFKVNPK